MENTTPHRKTSRHTRLLTSALAAALISVGLVTGAGTAQASGGVNIVIGNWHCSQGGSISWSQGLTSFPSGSTKGAITGNRYNDVGVWYNQKNTYSATVYCEGWVWKGWYWSYVRYYQNINPNQQTFWPSSAGQTFYL
jgi:hypothetical protein